MLTNVKKKIMSPDLINLCIGVGFILSVASIAYGIKTGIDADKEGESPLLPVFFTFCGIACGIVSGFGL